MSRGRRVAGRWPLWHNLRHHRRSRQYPRKRDPRMRKPLRKAIFPVGGLGTRFLPATKAMPKEMLPVVDKPLIQYAVEEAQAAGIEQLIFVTGRGKSAIEDHFDISYELQQTLEQRRKSTELGVIRESLLTAG